MAEALGFIRVTERGRGGNAEYRAPNKFYSTFSTWTGAVPTDEWRKIKTIEEAGRVAKAAQGAKSEVAVAFGKRSSQRRNKTNPSTGKCHVSVRETDTGNPSSPVRVTHTTGSVQKPILLSISGVGGAAPASSLSVPALEPVAASLQPDLRKIGLVWSAPTLVELEWDASWAAVYAAEFPKARSFV